MEQLVRDGLTKSVGVADLSTGQLKELYEQAAVSPVAYTLPPLAPSLACLLIAVYECSACLLL